MSLAGLIIRTIAALHPASKRCITCAHWEKKEGSPHDIPGSGKCLYAREIWQVTEEKEHPQDPSLDHRVLMTEHAALEAFVEDGSSYRAELVTMPAFGCIQHKEKT